MHDYSFCSVGSRRVRAKTAGVFKAQTLFFAPKRRALVLFLVGVTLESSGFRSGCPGF